MSFVITPDISTFVTFQTNLPKATDGAYATLDDARTIANYVLGVSPSKALTISEVVETLTAKVVVSTVEASAADVGSDDAGTAS